MQVKTIMRFVVLIILVTVIVWVSSQYRSQIDVVAIRTAVQNYGIWAPLVFILIYIVATVLFLPGLLITLAGGLLFGALWGTLYNVIGAVIGSTLAFYIARYIASDWVTNKTGGKVKQLIDGVNNQGWKFIAVVRLVPLLPFNLLNYALGLTRIPVWDYIWASALFMLPGTFVYTYVGSLGEAVIQGNGKNMAAKIMLGVALIVVMSLIPWFIKKCKGKKS